MSNSSKVTIGICFAIIALGVSVLIGWSVTRGEPVAATLDVDYVFADDAAGYAQGEITVTPVASERTDGWYLLYFGDHNGPLAGYDELASAAITGETVSVTIGKATWLPPEATRLLVFESDHRFAEEPPTGDRAVGEAAIPRHKRLCLSKVELSFGAVSDVHMNYQTYGRGAYEKWAAALTFFHDQQTDMLIVAGDMTGDPNEAPLAEQYETYLGIIEDSPYDPTCVYEAIGNHGNTESGRETFVAYTAGADEEHPYAGSPYYSVRKGNNLFIVMAQELNAPGDSAKCDNFSEEQLDWVESLLGQYSGSGVNVFLIEHAPIYNFSGGDRHNGDYTSTLQAKAPFLSVMRFRKMLRTYPDVIMLSGHTHVSLYDGWNYADDDGNAARMIHLGSTCQPTSYGTGERLERSTDGRHPVTVDYGSEAYMVTVYKTHIVFKGYNLSTGQIIPKACLLLPTENPKN